MPSDQLREAGALLSVEGLGIVDAGQEAVRGHDHGRDHDRTGQGPPADLVDARYPAESGSGEEILQPANQVEATRFGQQGPESIAILFRQPAASLPVRPTQPGRSSRRSLMRAALPCRSRR